MFSLALWEEDDRALLFSGSGDHNIKANYHLPTSLARDFLTNISFKAWDVDSLECVATLEGHKYDVRALTVVGNRLFSGCYDMTIKVI